MKKLFVSMIRVAHSRVFRRILMYYLVLIFAVGAACATSFIFASRLSRENVIERSELVLENAGYQISAAFSLAEYHNNILYHNNDLQALLGKKRDADTLVRVYELVNKLPVVYDSTQIITGYYVYLPAIDYIIAPSSGASQIDLYYNSYFAFSQAQTCEEWRKSVLEGDRNSMHASYQEHSDILYSTRLPSYTVGTESGRVIYTLSSKSIINLITRAFSGNDQYVCITDAEGLILCADAGFDEDAILNGYTHINCDLAVNGLQAHIYVSDKSISQEAAHNVRPLLITLIWMLALALLLIILVAVSNLSPLIGIAERAEEMGGNTRGLRLISEAFSQVDKKRQELQHTLAMQNEYLRSACVNRLIRGSERDPLELEEMLNAAQIELHGTRFRACIIVFEHLAAGANAQALGLDVLENYAQRLTILTLESTDTILALYSEEEGDSDVDRTFFVEVYNALKENANIESVFFLGDKCESPETISDSFAQANDLRRSSSNEGTWLNVYVSTGGDSNLGGVLNSAEQMKIKESILSGDSDSALKHLEAFENSYFIQSSSHGFKRQYVFCRLVEVLIDCGQNLDTRLNLPPDIMNMRAQDFFEWIRQPCLALCLKANDRLNQRNHVLGNEVLNYIEEHYSDYNLTLASLSDKLNLTGAYLSGLFKKQFGTNFSAYLEQVRIGHAAELLEKQNLSIEEIAQSVGYGNADSFRRAFKRAKGVSPRQYRETV